MMKESKSNDKENDTSKPASPNPIEIPEPALIKINEAIICNLNS